MKEDQRHVLFIGKGGRMIAVNRSENPYGVTFHIRSYVREQICPKCKRVLDEGNHVVMVSDPAGQLLYLGREEGRGCCGGTYWTLASFEAEFQARFAIETYVAMLREAHPRGINFADVVPVVAHNFRTKEDTVFQ